jgi:hypothetical protein
LKHGQIQGILRVNFSTNYATSQRYNYLLKYYIQLLTRKFKTNGAKGICRPMAVAASGNWKLGSREDEEVEAEEVILRL